MASVEAGYTPEWGCKNNNYTYADDYNRNNFIIV